MILILGRDRLPRNKFLANRFWIRFGNFGRNFDLLEIASDIRFAAFERIGDAFERAQEFEHRRVRRRAEHGDGDQQRQFDSPDGRNCSEKHDWIVGRVAAG